MTERSALNTSPGKAQQWSLHRGVSSSPFVRSFFSSTAVEGANSNTLDKESQLLNTHTYSHIHTLHTHTTYAQTHIHTHYIDAHTI